MSCVKIQFALEGRARGAWLVIHNAHYMVYIINASFFFNISVMDYMVKHYEYIIYILKTESVFKGFLNNEGHNILAVTILTGFMWNKWLPFQTLTNFHIGFFHSFSSINWLSRISKKGIYKEGIKTRKKGM